MSETLFPAMQDSGTAVAAENELPLAREVAWDFEQDRPIFHRGEPVIVTGLEAVLVWAWNALKTERFRYRHHSRAYGSEMERLIGQTFTGDLKRAEAARYFREALEPNPYITGVEEITAELTGDRLHVTGTIRTIYGDKEVYADV